MTDLSTLSEEQQPDKELTQSNDPSAAAQTDANKVKDSVAEEKASTPATETKVAPDGKAETEEEIEYNKLSDAITASDNVDLQELNKRLSEMSEEEILNSLAELLSGDVLPKRLVVDQYRKSFNKLIKSDSSDEESETFEAQQATSANEERLKDLLQLFKEQNQKRLEEQEKEFEANLITKEALIKRLKDLLSDQGDFGQISPIFHEIRKEWKEVGPAPHQHNNKLIKEYNLLVEQFYDLKQINDEFREYDFKKNLEAKLELIKQAEELTTSTDYAAALRSLQDLHNKWRDLGPVARNMREEIWRQFKAASTTINKNHHEFFIKQKEQTQLNLQAKEALCVEIESIDYKQITSPNKWQAKTKEVLDVQAKWKTIGYSPKAESDRVYERFRTACDVFFNNKKDFFAAYKEEQQLNYQKKLSLTVEAEALQDSSEWGKSTKRFVEMQKEWKQIGPTAHKQNQELWNRFSTACDNYFNRKKEDSQHFRSIERENLKKKQDLIDELRKLLEEEDLDKVNEEFGRINSTWKSVGHVPFREKDKIHSSYRDLLEELHQKLGNKHKTRRLEAFSASLDDANAEGNKRTLLNDRDKMMRALDRMRQEEKTYSNNLEFLKVSSKEGNTLLGEMEKRLAKLHDEIALLIEKIKLLDEKLDELEK